MRLFSPSDNSAFLEFVTFMAQLSSNNLLEYDQEKVFLDWVTNQIKAVLETIFAAKSLALEAALESLVLAAERHGDGAAFEVLFNADVNGTLCRERRDKLMLRAVRLDKVKIVQALLDRGIDVNSKIAVFDDDGRARIYTFLGSAKTGAMVETLIKAGADLDTKCWSIMDGEHLTPISRAARESNKSLLYTLRNAGAHFDPNEYEYGRLTLLAAAIHDEDLEYVNLLLEAGAVCIDVMQGTHNLREIRPATEMQRAAYSGSTEIIQALVNTPSGRAILASGKYHWAPLRDAAMKGHLEVVEILIKAGANVNSSSHVTEDNLQNQEEDEAGVVVSILPSSPLMAAVEGGHLDVVRSLLHHKVDVSATAFGKHGTNVLEVAENLGHFDIALILIEAGATKSLLCEHQIIEIWLAAMREDCSKIRCLLANGLHVCNILDAIEVCQGEFAHLRECVIAAFIECCGDQVNARSPKTGFCALGLAVEMSSLKFVKRLVEAGANVNVTGRNSDTAIQIAVAENDHEMVQWLLSAGADLSQSDQGKLFSTASRCGSKILRLLLDYGADIHAVPGEFGMTALQAAIACTDSCIELVQDLLERGADVNAQSSFYSWTALQIAIKGGGSIEMIQLLLDYGADIDASSGFFDGRTALQIAINKGRSIKIIRLLLERGADINAPPEPVYGRTALQMAIDKGRSIELIQFLLDRGANINAPAAATCGFTALQGAAISGQLKIAHMLLERGADLNAVGSLVNGRTALEGAAEHGRLDMVQLLLNTGAEPTSTAVRYAEKEQHFVIANLIRTAIEEAYSDSSDSKANRRKESDSIEELESTEDESTEDESVEVIEEDEDGDF